MERCFGCPHQSNTLPFSLPGLWVTQLNPAFRVNGKPRSRLCRLEERKELMHWKVCWWFHFASWPCRAPRLRWRCWVPTGFWELIMINQTKLTLARDAASGFEIIQAFQECTATVCSICRAHREEMWRGNARILKKSLLVRYWWGFSLFFPFSSFSVFVFHKFLWLPLQFQHSSSPFPHGSYLSHDVLQRGRSPKKKRKRKTIRNLMSLLVSVFFFPFWPCV